MFDLKAPESCSPHFCRCSFSDVPVAHAIYCHTHSQSGIDHVTLIYALHSLACLQQMIAADTVTMTETTKGDRKRKRQRPSVYDAVAGRVGYDSIITEQRASKHRDTASNTLRAVPPEEVLFRRKEAPVRYEEDDLYFQDRHLEAHRKLPDSDLLKSIHAYASNFYRYATTDGGKMDWRSLDETALIAMGVLLEEAADEILGETGDLALADGDNGLDEPTPEQPTFRVGSRWERSVLSETSSSSRRPRVKT